MNQRLLSYIILKQHVEKVAQEIGIDATMDIIYRIVVDLNDKNGQNTALQGKKTKVY